MGISSPDCSPLFLTPSPPHTPQTPISTPVSSPFSTHSQSPSPPPPQKLLFQHTTNISYLHPPKVGISETNPNKMDFFLHASVEKGIVGPSAHSLRQMVLFPSMMKEKWMNLKMITPLGDGLPAHLPSAGDLRHLPPVFLIYLLWRMEKLEEEKSILIVPPELETLMDPPAVIPSEIDVLLLHFLKVNLTTKGWTNTMALFQTKWPEEEVELEILWRSDEAGGEENQTHMSLAPKTFHLFFPKTEDDPLLKMVDIPIYPPKKKFDMKALYWNARGIARPKFISNLNTVIYQHHPHLIIISETKVARASAEKIVENLPFDGFAYVDPVGLSGGIMLLWDSNHIKFEPVRINRQGIHGLIEAADTGASSNIDAYSEAE